MASRSFRLYDTMSRQVKELVPSEPGHLRFYSCGPTVYSYAHIGNFRTFLTADLVVRTAEAIGWRVSYVGHLTEDSFADAEGEDKMARALQSKEGERFNNVWELAEYYETAFEEDWSALNLRVPTVRPKATQHMREQILAAAELITDNHAYETPSGVYFSVASFPEYGKLSGNTQENLMSAVRDVVQDDNKRAQADFALWKKDDKHLMQWFSPFGWGFPGWHLECSVMARAYLGETIDLHGGGEDLIFPHHECEIAQSESMTGKTFSRHWIHTRFLLVNGEKMSKSAGNYFTVRDLLGRGADPLALRYALMGGVYGKQLNFTEQGLRDAAKSIERFKEALSAAEQASREHGDPKGEPLNDQYLGTSLEELYDDCLAAMLNDLNTSVALAKALEGARLIQNHSKRPGGLTVQDGENAKSFLEKVNALLGIVRHEGEVVATQKSQSDGPDATEVDKLIAERAEAKANKDYAKADAVRAKLDALGIEVQDSPTGTVWKAKPRI
jgi:cysteinyl-tRNA synthetase